MSAQDGSSTAEIRRAISRMVEDLEGESAAAREATQPSADLREGVTWLRSYQAHAGRALARGLADAHLARELVDLAETLPGPGASLARPRVVALIAALFGIAPNVVAPRQHEPLVVRDATPDTGAFAVSVDQALRERDPTRLLALATSEPTSRAAIAEDFQLMRAFPAPLGFGRDLVRVRLEDHGGGAGSRLTATFSSHGTMSATHGELETLTIEAVVVEQGRWAIRRLLPTTQRQVLGEMAKAFALRRR